MIGVLIDDLVFDSAPGDSLEVVLLGEVFEHVGADPHEVIVDVRRADLEPFDLAMVFQGGKLRLMVDLEGRSDVLFLDLGAYAGVQIGDDQQVVFMERFGRDSQLFGDEPHGGEASPFAVAAVSHLFEGLEQVSSGDLFTASDPDHPAAPFGLCLSKLPRIVTIHC